jgi:hypothetical protein
MFPDQLQIFKSATYIFRVFVDKVENQPQPGGGHWIVQKKSLPLVANVVTPTVSLLLQPGLH